MTQDEAFHWDDLSNMELSMYDKVVSTSEEHI